MKTKIILPHFLAAAAALMGCNPALYHPGSINAPLFSRKGELNVAASMSNSGTEVQASYSISDKAAVMLNWSGGNKMKDFYTTDYNYMYDSVYGYSYSMPFTRQSKSGYRFNYTEGGYGFYLKPQIGRKLRAEVFGLVGAGDAEAGEDWVYYNATVSYLKYFLQANIGWAGEVTEGALSIRYGYLDLSGMQTKANANYQPYGSRFSNSYESHPDGDRSSFFFDPALIFRLGYKGVKLEMQYGISLPSSTWLAFGWVRCWASMGMKFRINTSKNISHQ